jgi:hypothetical protein
VAYVVGYHGRNGGNGARHSPIDAPAVPSFREIGAGRTSSLAHGNRPQDIDLDHERSLMNAPYVKGTQSGVDLFQ